MMRQFIIKWTPVVESYPTVSGQYLVTYVFDDNVASVGVSEYQTDTEYPSDYGFGPLHDKVVAWAELPSPYIHPSHPTS